MDKEKLKKLLKIADIAKTVILWAIVAVSVFMMIFTVISVTFFNKNNRNILGYRIYVVASDSMSATDFSAYDVIFAKVYDDYTNLQDGEIISFISLNNDSYGKTITHKIRRSVETSEGRFIGYVTYGTTTNTDDDSVVTPDLIQGVYRGKIPKLGHFLNFIKSTVGYILCILIPFALLIMWQGLNCVRLFRRYKAEQMEEIKAEKDEIARERGELQSMMAELMALKNQMAQNSDASPSEADKGEQASENSDIIANDNAFDFGDGADAALEDKSSDSSEVESVEEENSAEDNEASSEDKI